MHRSVQHTLHVSLGYDETCRRIDESGARLLERATAVAASTVSRQSNDPKAVTGADPIRLATHALVRGPDHHATMTLDWRSASPDRRLLPHLRATLVINGVILQGPHASTAVSVLGTFDHSGGLLHRIDDVVFRRKLVDEAVEAFLDSFVAGLMDSPIDLRTIETSDDASSAA